MSKPLTQKERDWLRRNWSTDPLHYDWFLGSDLAQSMIPRMIDELDDIHRDTNRVKMSRRERNRKRG